MDESGALRRRTGTFDGRVGWREPTGRTTLADAMVDVDVTDRSVDEVTEEELIELPLRAELPANGVAMPVIIPGHGAGKLVEAFAGDEP